MGNQSLKNLLIRFSLYEFVYTMLVIFLFLNTIIISINTGFTYPANQPEKYLIDMQQKVSEGKLKTNDIPVFYEYELEENGEIVETTIPKKDAPKVLETKKTGRSQSNWRIGTTFFVKLEGPQQRLILSYKLLSDFASPRLRRFLPPAEWVYFGSFLLLWLLGFGWIIQRVLRHLKTELSKIEDTYKEVQNLNLEYEPQVSSIKEIDQILDSMNGMSKELRTSLESQWKTQKQQQNLFQGITHDIRTPVTVIKGNQELLEETNLNDKQVELLKNAEKGIDRLERSIEQLKQISGITDQNENKEPITYAVLDEWIEMAKNLCDTHGVVCIIRSVDPSIIQVYKEQITRALQNIILNSIENMAAKKEISLSFEDQSMSYVMTLKDTGSGFTPESLKRATEKFYSTKHGNGNAGLGLSIVSDIVERHDGEWRVENIEENGKISGAKVQLII